MGKQRCIYALFGSYSWLFSCGTLYDIYDCYDENSYISIICYSTNVYCNEVEFILKLFYLFIYRNSRAFRKSCNDVLESRRAIQNLNTLYADLTADELANVTDTTCIICREEMQIQQSIKRLSCQHVFHKNCLRSWFQRQQTCMFF